MSRALNEADLAADPIAQFRVWFAEVNGAAPQDQPIALATATPDGRPSVRHVLLRGVDDAGFRFYTNYLGRKGRELTANPRAAFALHWAHVERQVIVEGRVERLSAPESDDYFRTRPALSRLSAAVSPQSEVIADRGTLEAQARELLARHAGDALAIPRPDHWGGFRLLPDTIEFWQGRDHRLHDRLRYRLAAGGWVIERLAP